MFRPSYIEETTKPIGIIEFETVVLQPLVNFYIAVAI